MGKYVSAMVAAGARITYASQNTELWLVVVLVTSVVATVYQLYWDYVKDWGLLNPKSRNPWLRDDLILKNKSIYYVSIVSFLFFSQSEIECSSYLFYYGNDKKLTGLQALNLVLRVAWVETVTRFNVGMLESRMLDFFLASLEVIRRGHWNFYRYFLLLVFFF